MKCENVKECSCPKTSCINHGRCCACVIKHKTTDSLPFCLFPDNGGDKSIPNYYKKLKQRFEGADADMEPETKTDKAGEYFDDGFNCAQAVLAAYCADFKMDKSTALKTAHAFGAGMGRLQEVCGAVTGAFMVLSLKYGSDAANDIAAKENLYAKVREFDNKFKSRNKTVICRELLCVDLINGDKAQNTVRVKAVCPKMVKDAVEILEEIMNIEKLS